MKSLKVIILTAAVALAAWAQTPAKTRASGTVTAVDPQAHHITIKTEKGEAMTLTVGEHTYVRHQAPGETKATDIKITDVAVNDKLVASGVESADHKSMDAGTILVLTTADIAAIHKQEDEDWQKRGTSGVVTAVDAAAKTVTIKIGQREQTVQTSDKTTVRRYSPDSFKGSDAKPSTFAEIKPGDQLRVLGNHEGDKVMAEQILAGTFRQIAATVDSYDPQTHELKVKDLSTKKPLSIKVDTDSQLNKLPPEQAAMLARVMQGGGRGRGDGQGQGAGAPPAGGPPADGTGRGFGGRGRGGRGDMAQVLDHLPPMPVADLKKGDAIMVLTTEGSDPSKVTAIRLLAGVEPLLTSPNAARDIMSGWNLGGGGGGEGN